jgi:hypothetical protein
LIVENQKAAHVRDKLLTKTRQTLTLSMIIDGGVAEKLIDCQIRQFLMHCITAVRFVGQTRKHLPPALFPQISSIQSANLDDIMSVL